VRTKLVWGAALVSVVVLGFAGYAVADTHASTATTTRCTPRVPGEVSIISSADYPIVGNSIIIDEDEITPGFQMFAQVIGHRSSFWVTSTQTSHGLGAAYAINLNRSPANTAHPVRILTSVVCLG